MKCPECGSMEIERKTAESHCKICGLVVDDSMPNFGHYREGTAQDGTEFVNGRIVRAAWMLNAKQKNLHHAKKKLCLVASKLYLPKYVQETAFEIYNRAVYKDLCIGRDNSSILLASVYIACNQNCIPKTVMEITDYSKVDKKHLLRACKLLKTELNLDLEISDPIDMLPRFATNLHLSHRCLAKAMEILNKIRGTSAYSGKNPKSIIAAVLYLSAKLCGEKLSQREVANAVCVMETTIRKRYKEIEMLV